MISNESNHLRIITSNCPKRFLSVRVSKKLSTPVYQTIIPESHSTIYPSNATIPRCIEVTSSLARWNIPSGGWSKIVSVIKIQFIGIPWNLPSNTPRRGSNLQKHSSRDLPVSRFSRSPSAGGGGDNWGKNE